MIRETLIPTFRIKQMICGTPLLAIEFEYNGEPRTVYAKAESFNMTGSIKDRMALYIIEHSYREGLLKSGDKIIEATSGNTGISFAAIGAALGHPVTIFMPDWMSDERVNLIKRFGAEMRLVSKEEGGFLGSIAMTKEIAEKEANIFLPNQFDNTLNAKVHYISTGPEIWRQMHLFHTEPKAVVAGVGTGGTIMGVGKYLKEQDKNIFAHPLEPANSPTLRTGHKLGRHRIQGISDEFIPSIVHLDELDSIVDVDDGDAIIMAQKLTSCLGIGAGISSGANFLGACKIQEELGDNAAVVTVFSDSNKKYLSTDLMKEEPVKPGFISSNIKLLRFSAVR